MFDDYVSKDSTPLYKNETGTATICHLLWGDGIFFDGSLTGETRASVRARGGRKGWVSRSALGGKSLLEFYFIDVGQGDGLLIKTPGFRHIAIDGGFPRTHQDTGKNAADFIDWKFFKDYGMDTIELDAMLVSHCDADHYGGLWDLLDVAAADELDTMGVRVENIYHAGLSWWRDDTRDRFLGDSATVDGERYWTSLLRDRTHAQSVVDQSTGLRLQGWWHDFVKTALLTNTRAGTPTPLRRISSKDNFVPEFESAAGGEPVIRVLGPVECEVNGEPALRKFTGGNSVNTNGTSLLLRVDYGRTRILLTGDLNKASQRKLLTDYTGNRLEFQSDVAKACHHGSDDVSYAFLQAIHPAATIISSGDNENHDHPRPTIIAASATTGYLQLDETKDDIVTPLIYSTELGRSVDLGTASGLDIRDATGAVVKSLSENELGRVSIALNKAKRDSVNLRHARLVGGLIYGLVNVRTDGDRILCATLNEGDKSWNIKSFYSRF